LAVLVVLLPSIALEVVKIFFAESISIFYTKISIEVKVVHDSDCSWIGFMLGLAHDSSF